MSERAKLTRPQRFALARVWRTARAYHDDRIARGLIRRGLLRGTGTSFNPITRQRLTKAGREAARTCCREGDDAIYW